MVTAATTTTTSHSTATQRTIGAVAGTVTEGPSESIGSRNFAAAPPAEHGGQRKSADPKYTNGS